MALNVLIFPSFPSFKSGASPSMKEIMCECYIVYQCSSSEVYTYVKPSGKYLRIVGLGLAGFSGGTETDIITVNFIHLR